MTDRRKISTVRGAVLGLTLCLWGPVMILPASAQGAAGLTEMQTQIQRLQRDMQDLQAELFRNGIAPRSEGLGATDSGSAAPLSAIGPLSQRVNDIEQGLRRVTGEMETLLHRLNQVSQQMERMQNQLDYVEGRTASDPLLAETEESFGPGAVATFGGAEPAPRGNNLAPAPTGNVLGTLPMAVPAVSPSAPGLPAARSPVTGGDPETEFSAAMNLLARAQYDQAGEAFRAFAAAHPDTELGAQALYWTGDIAYSVTRDYQVAAREFAQLLKTYPQAPRAPEGMLKLGLSLLALGQTQEGCVTLAALPRTYPNAGTTIANRAQAERGEASCS